MRKLSLAVVALQLVWGCGGKSEPGAGDGSTGVIATTGVTATGSSTTADAETTAVTASGSTSDSASSSASESTSTEPSSTTDPSATEGTDETGMNDPKNPLDCGGTVYACGNGEDDDGDGLVDLQDPECTGPCDDDESSFATGIPGDNMDCKQDCFFDGNSGQGDDKCIWDLRCDPENPGANINCEYTGGNNCNNQPPNQSEDCIEFCEPFVPPGCDCFGCCTVSTDEGDVNIFLNSSPDCALDNLEACESCTPTDDCDNPCDEPCELCFGEDELPPECDEADCDFGDPCDTAADCPVDWYCQLDCCYPPPPG